MKTKKQRPSAFATAVCRALCRSARVARKIARDHGTPVYIWRDGKVVAEKPCAPMKAGQPFAANAFAAVLTKERKAELATGDPEFKAVESEIRIAWWT